MKPLKPKTSKPALPKWAFPEIERPSFTDDIKFPENLPNLSSRDVGLYQGRYTALVSYAASELAKLTVEKLRVETAISKEYHHKVIALSVQNVQKWKIQNVVEVSSRMVTLKDDLLELNVKIETVRTYKENFERYASALSREQSRRASEVKIQ